MLMLVPRSLCRLIEVAVERVSEAISHFQRTASTKKKLVCCLIKVMVFNLTFCVTRQLSSHYARSAQDTDKSSTFHNH